MMQPPELFRALNALHARLEAGFQKRDAIAVREAMQTIVALARTVQRQKDPTVADLLAQLGKKLNAAEVVVVEVESAGEEPELPLCH
jgi:hypothetical protein